MYTNAHEYLAVDHNCPTNQFTQAKHERASWRFPVLLVGLGRRCIHAFAHAFAHAFDTIANV